MTELRWSRNALGYALELSSRNRRRIVSAAGLLRRFPRMGTALLGPYEGKRRLIVGPFNLVYEYREKQDEVLVLFIVYGGLGT